MTDLELSQKASEIQSQFADETISDAAIIRQIKEIPELIHAKLSSGSNLFLSAVLRNRFSVAMALSDMGADVNWICEASMIHGNALNVAHSPQQAEQLLALGVAIEKNLLLSIPVQNPAIMAASHNDTTMLLYWLEKQKEIFADDAEYVRKLYYATIDMVSMMNQYDMLSCVMADDVLFNILKDIYSRIDNVSSIRLYFNALGYIDDKSLDARKKELQKTLKARKKELSAAK